MAYTNSPLVNYKRISPNRTVGRNHKIDTITIHCVVGQCSVETLGSIFGSSSRQASSNYGIGPDGRIGMYVEEKDRSWCSSSSANDHRAVTIEVASDTTHPYAVKSAAYEALIKLCADICKRNGITSLKWEGNKSLIGNVARQNMTVHRWFANKSCPGDYLYNRHSDIAKRVNALLKSNGASSGSSSSSSSSGTLYRVQVGAFSKKANADSQLAKVKKAGFDTYMIKSGNLYKIQVGAFSKKANADALLKKVKAKGFDAFITTTGGSGVKSSTSSAKKSPTQVAKDIIAGKGNWGTGQTRKNRLEAAGYNYNEVQSIINKLMK